MAGNEFAVVETQLRNKNATEISENRIFLNLLSSLFRRLSSFNYLHFLNHVLYLQTAYLTEIKWLHSGAILFDPLQIDF